MKGRFARSIVHPGPLAEERIAAVPCRVERLKVDLAAGVNINQAVSDALAARGFTSGFVRLKNARVNPMRYVIPAPATDDQHAAWYSETFAPDSETLIEDAGFIVGQRDGQPFFHSHGTWKTPDLGRRAGHILPLESCLAAPVEAEAWGISGAVFQVHHDPETNFRLFTPESAAAPGGNGDRGLILRVRPSEDINGAIETACTKAGIRDANIMGIGSLIGAVFENAPEVVSYATEVLITHGSVRQGKSDLEIMVVGIDGKITEGTLLPGSNPVCVTFELLIVETLRFVP